MEPEQDGAAAMRATLGFASTAPSGGTLEQRQVVPDAARDRLLDESSRPHQQRGPTEIGLDFLPWSQLHDIAEAYSQPLQTLQALTDMHSGVSRDETGEAFTITL